MADAQESVPMFTKQWRIAALAERFPQRAFTSLAHHMDAQWLMSAYLMTCRDSVVGIDGQTADDFASDVEANIQRLLEEAKSGHYRAPPVRRVHIPKGGGALHGRLASPSSKTRSCSVRWYHCWNHSTSMIFYHVRSVSDRDGHRIMRSSRYGRVCRQWAVAGSLTWTSRPSSTRSTINTCVNFCNNE